MTTPQKPANPNTQIFGQDVSHRCAFDGCSETGPAAEMYNEACDMNGAGILELIPSLVRCRYHAERIAESRGAEPCQPGSGIFPLVGTLRRLRAKFPSSTTRVGRSEDDGRAYAAWCLKSAHVRGKHAAEADVECPICATIESQ